MLFQVVALFARSYFQLELIEGGKAPELAKNLSYLIVPPILLVLLFPVLRQQRDFLARRFKLSGLTWKIVGTAVLAGLLLRTADWGRLIALIGLGVYRNDDPNALVGPIFTFSCPSNSTIFLHLFVMSFLTPVIEEVINRGLFLYSLIGKGRLIAIVASSVLFAVTHSPNAMPAAFVSGLFFAVFALGTTTLWAPIIAHATYNGMIVLDWMCLNGTWNPHPSSASLTAVGAAALSVVALSLYLCSRLVRGKCAGTNNLSQRSF
jgi:membrane protease YdiL (CAAX protease family)